MVINYVRPYLYDKQKECLFGEERIALTEAATKTGKTHGALVWLFEFVFLYLKEYQCAWWVAPTSHQAKIAFRRSKKAYAHLISSGIMSVNEVEMRIEIVGGGTVFFKSADNPDSLYGEDVYAVVFDEYNRARESAYHAIRSTVTATGGKIRLIGNVRDKNNWGYRFKRSIEQGLIPSARAYKLTAYDAADAGIISYQEIEDARAELQNDDIFNQLYLAEATENSLNPFGIEYIRNNVKPISLKPTERYGVDLARKQDYTVVIGVDEDNNVTEVHRFQASWQETIDRIKIIIGTTPTRVDATGVGDAVFSILQQEGYFVESVIFSQPVKQELIENLTYLIQKGEIGYPEGFIVDELCSMQREYTSQGKVLYYTDGDHDDGVYSLALAVRGRGQTISSWEAIVKLAEEINEFIV